MLCPKIYSPSKLKSWILYDIQVSFKINLLRLSSFYLFFNSADMCHGVFRECNLKYDLENALLKIMDLFFIDLQEKG